MSVRHLRHLDSNSIVTKLTSPSHRHDVTMTATPEATIPLTTSNPCPDYDDYTYNFFNNNNDSNNYATWHPFLLPHQLQQLKNCRDNNVTTDGDTMTSFPVSPLIAFNEWYQGIHGYVSLVVCIFGIFANVINIRVLTRKSMQTPTNCLLTALATADLFTMMSYLPYAVYFHCISAPDADLRHSEGWIFYLLFHTYFIITTHTISMWLTVALALFRYIVVCHHLLGPRLCNMRRAKQSIAAIFVITVIFCLPNYVLYRSERLESGGYWFGYNDFISDFHKVFNFWLFGVVLKVVPCFLLAILSSLLIKTMREASKRRKKLKKPGRKSENLHKATEKDRTTYMLIVVVLCFVVTELPQGILAFLSGVDEYIFDNVYVPLGDIWDILVLVNSSANFILYCTMSAQYRKTFREDVLRRKKKAQPALEKNRKPGVTAQI